MKQTLTIPLAILASSFTAIAQGTFVFNNDEYKYPVRREGVSASPSYNIYVDIVWAPSGVTDPSMFQRVPGDSVPVGIPDWGEFSGGIRTIPAGTGFDGIAPGAVVSCIVRAWYLDYGADFESVDPFFRATSGMFTVDTADPTTVPAEPPTYLVNFQGLWIPEPAGAQIAAVALFAWIRKQGLLSKASRQVS